LDNILDISDTVKPIKKTNSDKIKSILGCRTFSKRIKTTQKRRSSGVPANRTRRQNSI
jgi:hypothetical protein